MTLSKRLELIAKKVETGDIVADVGCDHAYLSIYLVKNFICDHVIATEISKGPYNNAKNNIVLNGVENKIKLYLTDGLSNVTDYINTIIISGMGTDTIMGILNNYNNLNNINKIIISSHNKYIHMRKFLNQIGFIIVDEEYIDDKNKMYLVMTAKKSSKKNTSNEINYGLKLKKNVFFYEWYLKKILLLLKEVPKYSTRYQELEKEIEIIKEYIN